MIFSGPFTRHGVTQILAYGSVIGFVLINATIGFSQSWPVNNPEVREPVPQYSPRLLPESPAKPNPPAPANRRNSNLKRLPSIQQIPSIPNSKPDAQPVDPTPVATKDVTQTPPHGSLESEPTVNPKKQFADASFYRDRNALPIDPRKPCDRCTRPLATQAICASDLPGLRGRPYKGKEPGACECGKIKPFKHPGFSVHWPRPFSAKLDELCPNCSAKRNEPCQNSRVVDAFDRLANFKLINYQRSDNGYCGRGADPYGCLGESKLTGGSVNR